MYRQLPQKEYCILDLLRSGVLMYGLEMVKASKGVLKRGTVYVTLNRMVERGYLKAFDEHDTNHPGLPRKRYQINGAGQTALRQNEQVAAQFAAEV